MSEKSRKENAKLREEALENQQERDAEVNAKRLPSQITATDAQGVERIVVNVYDYEAPQVDPDPKEVKRLKAAQARLDNQKQEREKLLSTRPDGSAKVAADAIKAESKSTSTAPTSTTSTSTTSTS